MVITDKKRTKSAKLRTQRRKVERAQKRMRTCNGVPCVEGCPMVACK